jgi:hypothetical protein
MPVAKDPEFFDNVEVHGPGEWWEATAPDNFGHPTVPAAGPDRSTTTLNDYESTEESFGTARPRAGHKQHGIGWPRDATYQFAYALNGSNITQTDITNPRGFVERLAFNSDRTRRFLLRLPNVVAGHHELEK